MGPLALDQQIKMKHVKKQIIFTVINMSKYDKIL